nr:MAG TPA: hypothetical protein [Caudoviricetes sp.]
MQFSLYFSFWGAFSLCSNWNTMQKLDYIFRKTLL